MSISYETYWRDIASGKNNDLPAKLIIICLTPLALLYSFAMKLRSAMYRSGILKTRHLPRPVVAIGNITVGGTGKTPVTSFIARFLLAQGYKVAVLSRGYGGSLEGQTCIVSDGNNIMFSPAECGDEPYLLASTIPGLMVVIGSNRYKAGQLALQQLSPDIFLLDDGFQHIRLHRDLNILLLDFCHPFGNDMTLPAGILREPVSAAVRADVIVYTRVPDGATAQEDVQGIPCCTSSHTIVDLLPLHGRTPVSFSDCSDKKILAFTGIANPDSFFDGLRSKGLNLVHTLSLPDHVVYDRKRSDEIWDALRSSEADIMITTEKDGVKLQGITDANADKIYLARLELTIQNHNILTKKIMELLQEP